MTDESETQTPSEGEVARTDTTPADDKRFEVKWKKKGESTVTPTPGPAEAPPPAAAEDEDEDVPTLRRRLDEANVRIADLQDKWHRASADLVNLRRRTEQEREDVERFASMMLVAELLPVLDNFERALETIPGNLAMLTWIQGVMLIERHFRAILDRQGLEPVEAEGKPFSPHLHEAISERETPDAEPGTVLQVYQKGYSMHSRLLRPALVELAKRPETSAGSPPSGDQSSPGDESRPREEEGTDEAQAQEISEEAETENTGP